MDNQKLKWGCPVTFWVSRRSDNQLFWNLTCETLGSLGPRSTTNELWVRWKHALILWSLLAFSSINPISVLPQMWHDQGKWVTCRQYSILSFQYNLLAHIKSYILIHTLLQSDIWFNRYEQFFKFQNIVKHRNMSSVLAYNSKSICSDIRLIPLDHVTYDSLAQWILSRLLFWAWIDFEMKEGKDERCLS